MKNYGSPNVAILSEIYIYIYIYIYCVCMCVCVCVLSEENNQCNVIKFLFLSIIFHVKFKKTLFGTKRNNFVLTLNLIFNLLTLKFWFKEISFYLVVHGISFRNRVFQFEFVFSASTMVFKIEVSKLVINGGRVPVNVGPCSLLSHNP